MPYLPAKMEDEGTVVDGRGDEWLIRGSAYLEDPESGERFSRSYVETKFGPLTEGRKATRSKGKSPPTVETFMTLLTSKLTQYDEQLSRKERRPNIYRLGHWLEAASKVRDAVLSHTFADAEITEPVASLIVGAMANHFTVDHSKQRFDLPPCRNVVKQLEAFLKTGKKPSLTG